MVTSNKQPDKKVLKMTDQPSSVMVVPQRTLLGEVNEHITCPLCRGYYIDATTIVECLHSFCRSCIIKHLQVKSYCPVCEMMINSAKPNIKPDKALQDIVYKLVPGLFQKEMERRQQFYASRPGPAACATPEQRGEDTERIIFSPEDVISFSLEYVDVTDTDSISSKSSDSNEPQPTTATSRRFLQCPAVVNISHLKKFISMKFDIDSTRFAIDILYKRVPLPDYYTLMDIAYIYNWKRNEPMRFFYQITDYIAIRTRYGLFDMNRNGSHFRDIKSSPTPTEETSASSPVPTLNEQLEASSGTESPMPDDTNIKKVDEVPKKPEQPIKQPLSKGSSQKKNDDEVEKSQFLNSFELTAKSSCNTLKPVTVKLNRESIKVPIDQNPSDIGTINSVSKSNNDATLDDSLMKRRQTISESPEVKKAKLEVEEKKSSGNIQPEQSGKNIELSQSANKQDNISKSQSLPKNNNISPSTSNIKPNLKQVPDGTPIKKIGASASPSIQSPKSKPNDSHSQAILQTSQSITKPPTQTKPQTTTKPPTPTKPKMANTETAQNPQQKSDNHKINKKIPDLKPGIPHMSSSHKNPAIGKVRMDLLANNSDPTIDRSKILSQVKTSLGSHNSGHMAGDPLKSLFDSCKINIPSSLSITLTDQKQEQRNTNEPTDSKKNVVNKNLGVGVGNVGSHKVPSPPVHNYIEILKLPDTDSSKKQQIKTELPTKSNSSPKSDSGTSQTKPLAKSSESSAKGPVPSLKPISDTKLGKGSPSTAAASIPTTSPITFQQTFEQQLQSEKTKLPKNKLQVPKLMPATPKAISAANKLNNLKTNAPEIKASSIKLDNILDLSSSNVQSNLDPQQTKKFETMQSIANLAKKQVMATKNISSPQSSSSLLPGVLNRPVQAGSVPIKLQPGSSNMNPIKHDKNSNPINAQASLRQDITNKNNVNKQSFGAVVPGTSSPTYQIASHSALVAQPSPRSQTRSPSSSPKLVIAEEKPVLAPELNMNQSNQITSTQIVNANALKNESSSSSSAPSTSKQVLKQTKNIISTSRLPAPSQNFTNLRFGAPVNNPADFLSQPQLLSAQHAILRHHMEMQNAWIKAQRQYDLFKNMSNINHQSDNKDNK